MPDYTEHLQAVEQALASDGGTFVIHKPPAGDWAGHLIPQEGDPAHVSGVSFVEMMGNLFEEMSQ